eukprot:GHVN01051213.1.p1 GENE.GHVN01051213.1~~GHVN01051213.1.p1  ORF type:complete len:176 (+),score=5.35 GHVN01051213.1:51-530(+)
MEITAQGMVVCNKLSDKSAFSTYMISNPRATEVDATPNMVLQKVNTETPQYISQEMQHSEGGWPSQLDSSDCYLAARNLWRRKAADRSIFFQETLRMLCSETLKVFREDALESLFEDYFGPPISGGGPNVSGVNAVSLATRLRLVEPDGVTLSFALAKI